MFTAKQSFTRRSQPLIEALESRQLMSAALVSFADAIAAASANAGIDLSAAKKKAVKKPHLGVPHVIKHPKSLATSTPVPGAYTPTQVRTAYGITTLGATNQGQGMTIGIVDEYDDSAITADANAFSTQYNLAKFDGLNGDPTLTVTKDTALGSVTSASGTGVAGETTLDVEWAHAMAPLANILLIEVPASNNLNTAFAQLLHGVQLAASKGAQVVSLSYGYLEASIGLTNVNNLNTTYLSSGAAANTVVAVSTGDDSAPNFPATSPNVVAVGGTSLYLSSLKGHYGYETAWGGLADDGAGGGGLSSTFAAPAFQSSNGVSYSKRAIPDLSVNADPVTGVSVYDSLDQSSNNGSPWTEIGGTSLATPLFAGMIALAQQTRVNSGKAILTSATVDSAVYSNYHSSSYSTYFNDITLGNNKNVVTGGTTTTGYSAATGYDLATGVGTPIGNAFLFYLGTV